MKRNYVWAAALLMLAACSNEDVLTITDNPDHGNEGRQVTVTATLPSNDSRVILQETTENGKNIIKVAWNDNATETFTVMTTAEQQVTSEEEDGGCIFTRNSGDNFTGTRPTAVSGQPYYAIYPPVNLYYVDEEFDTSGYNYRDEDTQCEITSFSATRVPFYLGWQDGILDENFTLMCATSTDGEQFDFHHLTAIVKFTLIGLPNENGPINIKIAWQGGNKPWGTFNLTESLVSAMYPVASESQECSVKVSTTNNNGTATFYAYLPPIAKEKTLNISYFKREDNKLYDYIAQVQLLQNSIEAGKYYRAERTVTKKEISTNMEAGDVQGLQVWVNAFRNYEGGINLTLTGNIDLSNADLDGVPTNNSNWPSRMDLDNVTIDGNGYTLTGLKMDVSGEGESAAMFSSVSGNSVVKNLHLRGVQLSSSQYFAAGLVADSYGTVSGCSVSGTISSTADGYAAGGVVASNTGTVTGCYNNANVSSKSNAGGVVGENVTYETKLGLVKACYSTGEVTATNYAGGVVGSNYQSATVKSCYWSGTGSGIGEMIITIIQESHFPEVDGTDVTWEDAASGMNEALPTDFGWQYQANTGTGKEAFPLVLQKTSGQ